MINNEIEYQVTLKWLDRFEQAYRDAEMSVLDPVIKRGMISSYVSMIAELDAALIDWEDNHKGWKIPK